MRKTLRRYLASFIVAIMLVSMVPALLPQALASAVPIQPMASPLSEELGLEFLLRGLNVLSGNELRNDTLSTYRLVVTDADESLRTYYDAVPTNETTARTYSGRNVVDWAVSAGLD